MLITTVVDGSDVSVEVLDRSLDFKSFRHEVESAMNESLAELFTAGLERIAVVVEAPLDVVGDLGDFVNEARRIEEPVFDVETVVKLTFNTAAGSELEEPHWARTPVDANFNWDSDSAARRNELFLSHRGGEE